MNSRTIDILKKTFGWTIVFLISAVIAVWFRTYSLRAYVSDESYNAASILVLNKLIATFEKDLRSRSSGLDRQAQHQIAVRQANESVARDNKAARRTIHEVARQLDSQNPNAQKYPFLLGSDPFLYYDLTHNILKNGRVAEVRKGSKYLNPKMNYPLGHWEPFTLIPYVGYTVHRAITLFYPDTPLAYSVSWTPVVMCLLSLVVLLMLFARLAISYWAALAGAVLFLNAPMFIRRSMFGWYDNDPYNIFFPLALISILVYWFTARRPRPLLSAAMLGLALCLYSLFWQGWMFIAVLIAGSIALVALAELLLKDPAFKKTLLVLIGMPFVALLGIGLLFGPQEFFRLFQEGWVALNDFLTTQKLPLWPDLYIAVGELKRQTPSETIHDIGGIPFIALAVWGMLSGSFISLKRKARPMLYSMITVSAWAGVSFILSLFAMRFTLFCVTPLAILSAVGVHSFFILLKDVLQRYRPAWRPQLCSFLTVGALTIILAFSSTRHQYRNIQSMVHKIYNSTWNEAMLELKNKTPDSSVVYTWWPPGHFIKGIAERAVTFDGASINARQAYWLANVFLQTDERRAIGILRMIHTSANQASEYLLDEGLPLSEAAHILKSIAPLGDDGARLVLDGRGFSKEKTDKLLSLTRANDPAPAYLMVYAELIEKHLLLSYTGNWDFKKVEEIRRSPELLAGIPPPGQESYYEFLWQVSGGRPLCSDLLRQTSRHGNTIILGQDVEVNLATKQCRVNSARYGKGTPQYFYFLENGQIVKKALPNPNMSTALVIGERHGQIYGMLMPQSLAESLLMKLFFFEGAGLTYTKLLSQQKDATLQAQIDIFEIDWKRFENDLSARP